MTRIKWKKQRKVEFRSPVSTRYYIFTEGRKTEPNYFSGFKRGLSPIYKNGIEIHILPRGMGTTKILDSAQRYLKYNNIDSGSVWCVYDKDDFPEKDFDAMPIMTARINKENANLQYHLAWSNESFEVWLVLHFFEYAGKGGLKEYIDMLNRKFRALSLGEYSKNLKNIFEILLEHGNPKQAILRAERILSLNPRITPSLISPGTKVHLLVKELCRYLPDDIAQKFGVCLENNKTH